MAKEGDKETVTSETEKGCVCVSLWECCGGKGWSGAVNDGTPEFPNVTIYAKGGPQQIEVTGTFSKKGKVVNVKLHLGVSRKVKRFEWGLWRDAFLGRLKGLKEWQEEHGIQGADLHLTDGGMKIELEEMKTSAEETVICWPGWRPFRFEMMRFDLESDGLLKEQFEEEREYANHVKKSAFDWRDHDQKYREGQALAWQGKFTVYVCLDSVARIQVKTVAYMEASGAVLKHAYLVTEKAFEDGGTQAQSKRGLDRSAVFLEDAKKCLLGDWERAVSLLEIAATVDGNEEALGSVLMR